MSTGPVNNLSSSYLQSVLNSALPNAGLTANQSNNNLSGIDVSSLTQRPDNSRLSSFAQVMSTLQQLQQSDPSKYQQVTQQIATKLESAAQTAQSDGNTTAATLLTQLADDFTNASKSGQLVNIKDIVQAIGAQHRHHHHHAHSVSAGSDGSSSTSSSNGASPALTQLLSAFQANSALSDALNPRSIIVNTLSNAGINTSKG